MNGRKAELLAAVPGALAGWIASWWVTLPGLVQLWAVLILTDALAALVALRYQGKPWSLRSFEKGIWRKAAQGLLIWVAWLIGSQGSHFMTGVPLELPLGAAVAGYLAALEALSILRHVGETGTEVPFLSSALERLRAAFEPADGSGG